MTSPTSEFRPNESEVKELMDVANPFLYRRNAFRVLGINVESTKRQVVRQVEQLEMMFRLGGATSPVVSVGSFGLASDLDAIRNASRRASSPEQRIVDELFWFWPSETGHSSHDEGLQAVHVGNSQLAMQVWLRREKEGGNVTSAVHNLAVLAHMQALDIEVQGRELSREEESHRDNCWIEAMRRWNLLQQDELVWTRLGDRIVALNDPRLTPKFARALQFWLPYALALIQAQLALQRYERDQPHLGSRHLERLVDSVLPRELVDGAILSVVAPTRERIKQALKAAEDESDADSIHADETARRLIQQATPLLNILDAMLPVGHIARDSARDEVVRLGDRILTKYGNKTENWARTLEVETMLLGLARTQDLQAYVEGEIATIRENVRNGPTWCTSGYFELPASVLEDLERARSLSRAEDWDGALQILSNLLTGSGPICIGRANMRIVKRPFAHCLRRQAIRRTNRVIDSLNSERPVMTAVRKNIDNRDPRFMITLSLNEDLVAGRPVSMAFCMGCLSEISGTFSYFKFNNQNIIICKNCSDQDQEQRQSAARYEIAQAGQGLLLACELEMENGVGNGDSLARVREIARDIGAIIPDPFELRIKLGLVEPSDWVKGLRSPDAAIRECAAVALTRENIGSAAEVLPVLVCGLVDESASVRRAVEAALARIAPDWASSDAARSAIPQLIVGAELDDPKMRDAALHWLSQIDSTKADVVRKAVEEKEAAIRRRQRRARFYGRVSSVAATVALALLSTVVGLYYVAHPATVVSLHRYGLIETSHAIEVLTNRLVKQWEVDQSVVEGLQAVDPQWFRAAAVTSLLPTLFAHFRHSWSVNGDRVVQPAPILTLLLGQVDRAILERLALGQTAESMTAAGVLAVFHSSDMGSSIVDVAPWTLSRKLADVARAADSNTAIFALRSLRKVGASSTVVAMVVERIASSKSPDLQREGYRLLEHSDKLWWLRRDVVVPVFAEALFYYEPAMISSIGAMHLKDKDQLQKAIKASTEAITSYGEKLTADSRIALAKLVIALCSQARRDPHCSPDHVRRMTALQKGR